MCTHSHWQLTPRCRSAVSFLDTFQRLEFLVMAHKLGTRLDRELRDDGSMGVIGKAMVTILAGLIQEAGATITTEWRDVTAGAPARGWQADTMDGGASPQSHKQAEGVRKHIASARTYTHVNERRAMRSSSNNTSSHSTRPVGRATARAPSMRRAGTRRRW